MKEHCCVPWKDAWSYKCIKKNPGAQEKIPTMSARVLFLIRLILLRIRFQSRCPHLQHSRSKHCKCGLFEIVIIRRCAVDGVGAAFGIQKQNAAGCLICRIISNHIDVIEGTQFNTGVVLGILLPGKRQPLPESHLHRLLQQEHT